MNTQKYILEKYDLIGNSPIVIPEMGRRKLYQLFAELEFKIGAEVGVFMGRNAKVLLETVPNLKLYLIEPYANHPNNKIVYSVRDLKKAKRMAYKRLKGQNVRFVEKFSEEAINHIPDNSLDFVYIDGDHSYDFVMMDIILWNRKVREGGIISGHDYHYKNDKVGKKPYVTTAVNDYTKVHKIDPWFITDRHRKDQEAGDSYPSWFWVK